MRRMFTDRNAYPGFVKLARMGVGKSGGVLPILVSAVGLVLNGCGDKKATHPVVVYNCPANAAEIDALQRQIPGLLQETGIELRLNPFSGQEKLYAMLAAGQAPDVFYTNHVVRDQLAAEGRLLDLNKLSAGDPFVDRLWPYVVAADKSLDGGWYSVSNWAFTCGVYYNRDLFTAAGIPFPDSTWTWDDMVRAARLLTVDRDGDRATDQYGIFIGSHFVPALERMNHAPIPTRRDQMFVDIPPESQEVFRKYLALMDDGLMPDLRLVQAMGMQAPQMLESGRVAMLVEGVPHTTLYEMLTINWGVAPLPRFGHKPPLYFRAGSGGLSISATTKDPKAAWRVLEWIIAEANFYQPNPVLRDIDFVGGWLEKFPHLRDTGFREVWQLSERYNGGDARYFVRYSSWATNTILEYLGPLLDQLWAHQITVEELVAAVPEVNSRVRAALAALLKNQHLLPAFRENIEKQLATIPAN